MKLGQLVQNIKKSRFFGDNSLNITHLAYHTDSVKPGSCFVAIRGFQSDGHRFIPEAIQRGAKAVVVEKDISVPRGVSKIVVDDTRDCLARLSSFLFGEPTLKMRLVGITGTNGKTTTAHLLEAIWEASRRKPGLLSTVRYRWGGKEQEAVRTTPESYDLQKMFQLMVKEGVTDCVMEVTSHALDLKRVVGCHFDGAIFTNISEEHLDYHENMERYFASKAKLFRERLVVSEKKSLWAVLNWDDSFGKTLVGGLPAKVWRFSMKEDVEVSLKSFKSDWKGLQMEVKTPLGNLRLHSPLIGPFNAANILAAVSASLAMEIPLENIAAGVAAFQGVPGRLEKIATSKGFEIFVDYAHTPAALENVLSALRTLKPRSILTLFGCGGNRDRLKRPMMRDIALRLSDAVIVTSDNPRDEDPEAIIQEVMKDFQGSEKVIEIVDRQEAISHALKTAKPGDCVLIAGKGHETYQEIKGIKRPFDDRKVIRDILNEI